MHLPDAVGKWKNNGGKPGIESVTVKGDDARELYRQEPAKQANPKNTDEKIMLLP